MLFTINLPVCSQHLQWVVQFQGDLLHSLCVPHIGVVDVTNGWAKALRPDIDGNWIDRFCGWTIKDKSILVRMQAVASLLAADKQTLITHYDNNLRYQEAFADATPPPPVTTPLPAVLSEDAVAAYLDFFEMFYAPIFYNDKGYSIEAADLNGKRFTKNYYLEAYSAANQDLKVCPLCDGGMDGVEIDHWLAKKHFPELNCHPRNLVEICGACNGRKNKGEKLTLDSGVAEPFENWFHPHLRPAIGTFAIQIQPKGVPQLQGGSAQDEIRLGNLNELINLQSRWTIEYKTQVKRIQKKIRGKKDRGTIFNNNSLETLLAEWREDVHDEIGLKPNALLEESVLALASDSTSHLFEEFLNYAVS